MSGQNKSSLPGLVGVFADGLGGLEVQVTFDAEAEGQANSAQLFDVHVAQLRRAETKVAQAEGDATRHRNHRCPR